MKKYEILQVEEILTKLYKLLKELDTDLKHTYYFNGEIVVGNRNKYFNQIKDIIKNLEELIYE